MSVIKAIIGVQVIGLLFILGILMLQEMQMRDMEIKQWIEIGEHAHG